jgi:hypothetical protein
MDGGDDGGPVAERRLAEQAHGGVPGAGLAGQPPAVFGAEGQHGPDRQRERAGEVAKGGVDGDGQVHAGGDGRGVGEAFQIAAMVDEVGQGRHDVPIAWFHVGLQDVELAVLALQ